MIYTKNTKQEIIPSSKIKELLDRGMSKYAITKVGVSPKRVYKISNGETPGKRGR